MEDQRTDLAVFKYRQDFGRAGSVRGVFVESKSDVQAAMGMEAYLGEALGKHSEVVADINDDTIKMISDDPAVVKIVLDHDLCVGFNPMEYLPVDWRSEVYGAE